MTDRQYATALVLGAVLLLVLLFWGLRETGKAESAAAARSEAYWREYRATDPDVVACRAHGGLPVFSDLTSRIVDCKPLPPRKTGSPETPR